jgi:gag-polypeptide of LTR copia-type
LQIQHSKTALEAWNMLKNLYSPKGFSSEFLICKELFETTLSKYASMEEYLNKVKQLTDQLKAKGIELPNQVIVAWVLNNLTSPFEGFVTMVTQSYRTNSSDINLENLFFNLMDESRRQVSKDKEIALIARQSGYTRPNQTN